MTRRNGEHIVEFRRGRRLALVAGSLVLALTLSTAAASSAQAGRRDRGLKRGDFQQLVFPPELVMKHQSEIGLTADQKQILIGEMQAAQSDLVPLQLEMAELGETLSGMLAEVRVDEGQAVETARRVMQLESEVKSRHLLLVIRIKNLLTADQQAALRRIRDRSGA